MLTNEEIRIIEGCRNGDVECQKMLYDTYGPLVKGVCLRYTSDIQEAEDLFHDIFISILTHFDEYDNITSLGGWLRRITVNKAIDYWRHKQTQKSVLMSELSVDIMDEKPDNYDGIPMQVLLECIQQLPPKYRTAFNLYVIDEIDQKQICEMMQETLSNVRSLISRARAMLRKSIGKYLKNEEFHYE
jgi:RNA polymerase sigma-70 factor (ECF subfamily)